MNYESIIVISCNKITIVGFVWHGYTFVQTSIYNPQNLNRDDFDLASQFYILSSFHGFANTIDELLRLRLIKDISSSLKQASDKLETARAWVVCSNYQKAEWHYHLAIFYGSEIAANEVDAMRDLIYYLEGGE